MRLLSDFLTNFFETRATMDARAYNTEVALDITMRNGESLRYATRDLTISTVTKRGVSVPPGDPLSFTGKLESTPEIFATQDDTADGSGIFKAVNLDYFLSALIPEPTRLLDRAECVSYLCYPKADGTYEGQILSVGRLRLAEGDDESADLSYVSDIGDRTITASGRELTQRCLNVFAVIDPELRSYCGAALDPNVDPDVDTCTNVFDDEEAGCKYWGQEATFQGISFFNPMGLVTGYGGPINDDGGWINPGGVGGGCADPDSYYLFDDGKWRQGKEVKVGAILLDHLGRPGEVDHAEIIHCEYRYLVKTSMGAGVICSVSHPMLTRESDEEGTAAIVLHSRNQTNKNMRLLDFVNGTGRLSRFTVQSWEAGPALFISMKRPRHIYIAGLRPNGGIPAHNKIAMYDGGNWN